MDAWLVAAGALTGFVVGMTGVGGGALMTPLLLLVFGTAPLVAVGTDLWFAAITKLAVSGLHLREGVIDWLVVRRLWTGSLPASVLTVAWMTRWPLDDGYVVAVKGAIAVAVCLTAAGLLAETPLRAWRGRPNAAEAAAPPGWWQASATVAAGAALGGLVTLTSVGAGALGVVVLAHLYPSRLSPRRLVATDIAHAIPLALCAGLGHLATSHVDIALLRDLLVGSVPAAILGSIVSARIPHAHLRMALGLVLFVIGLTMLRGTLIR